MLLASALLAVATTTAAAKSQVLGIELDWSISLGNLITFVFATIGIIVAFVRAQTRLEAKIEKLSNDVSEFKAGLLSFQSDFKSLGAQVVSALIAIARLEGKTGTGREEEKSSQLPFPWTR
jgi:hypothetical protein